MWGTLSCVWLSWVGPFFRLLPFVLFIGGVFVVVFLRFLGGAVCFAYWLVVGGVMVGVLRAFWFLGGFLLISRYFNLWPYCDCSKASVGLPYKEMKDCFLSELRIFTSCVNKSCDSHDVVLYSL